MNNPKSELIKTLKLSIYYYLRSNLKNKLALIEEYKEWITEGIFESNALYLIDKR